MARLTVVGRNQLVLPVVWLPTADILLAIQCIARQLVRPVHPVDACVDVMLVACANLEDASHPIVLGVGSGAWLGLVRLLALDGARVGDKDVVITEVLGAVD